MTLEQALNRLVGISYDERLSGLDRLSIETVLSHLETLKRDKERLDWMENCGDWYVNVTNENEFDEQSQWSVTKWEGDDVERRGSAATLRAAIDSAMSPAPQQKGEA